MNWINPYEPKNVAEKLRAYENSGISQAEIARRIGCTRAAVCRAVKRTGINIKRKVRADG